MTDENKNAVRWQGCYLTRLHISQINSSYLFISIDFIHNSIPDHFDLWIFCYAILQDLPGTEFIAPMNNAYFAGKTGQEQGFFERTVASAYNHHFFVLEEPAITGGTIRNAASCQKFFTRHIQFYRAGSCGQDQGVCRVFFAISSDNKRLLRKVHRRSGVKFKSCAKFFGLTFEDLTQL